MASDPASHRTDGVVFFDPGFNNQVHLLENVEQIDVQDAFAKRAVNVPTRQVTGWRLWKR